MTNIELIVSKINELIHYYNKILYFVGAELTNTQILKKLHESYQYNYISLSLELSKKTLNYDVIYIENNIDDLCKEIVNINASEVLLIDNIEMLFGMKDINIVGLLEKISRNATIVVSWPGNYKNGKLTYAELGHKDYREYVINPSHIIMID